MQEEDVTIELMVTFKHFNCEMMRSCSESRTALKFIKSVILDSEILSVLLLLSVILCVSHCLFLLFVPSFLLDSFFLPHLTRCVGLLCIYILLTTPRLKDTIPSPHKYKQIEIRNLIEKKCQQLAYIDK